MVAVKTNYEPLDHFLVRKPLLPVERYPSFMAAIRENQADQDCDRLAQMQSIFSDPKARVALLLGSLSLYRAALDQKRGSHGFDDIARKLLRYVIRMTSRSTPYGAFASVGIGEWSYRTDLSVAESIVTRTRPDMGWLCQYVFFLESQKDFRATLRVKANPLLFARANRFFLESQNGQDGMRRTTALSIRADGIVKFIVDEASTYIEWNTLKSRAIDYAGRPGKLDKIERLMSDLLSSGVLTSDLCPGLASASPGLELSSRVNRVDPNNSNIFSIGNLIDKFTQWDALPWPERESGLLALFSCATEVLPEVASTPVQVDCRMELAGANVSLEVGHEVAKAAELLLCLSRKQPGYGYLASYRRMFEERYGSERLVALQEVLDPEWGLGPPPFDEIKNNPSVDWMRRDEALLELIATSLRQGESQVELNDKLLSKLAVSPVDCGSLPPSIELYVMVAARSSKDIDAGDFKVIIGPNVGTHMAGKTFARFADLLGQRADTLMAKGVAADCTDRGNAVCAELTYRPRQDRLMNVMLRPIAAEYEIPIGVTPSLSAEHVIEFSDLLIGLQNDRFFLHSSVLNRDVIVSCQHMLNNIAAPVAVRFLSDLSRDGETQLSAFDWGAARKQPFLPRVSYGRVVLSVAEWKLLAQDYVAGPLDFCSRFEKFRRLWNVPRFIYVVEEDNRLLLNLDDRTHLEILREEVRSVGPGNYLVLQEVLPAFDECWLVGAEGTYISELVVPLRRKQSKEKLANALAIRVRDPCGVQQHRVRPPGSDWLYLKANIDSRIEEILLTSELAEFALVTKSRFGEIKMFFVRYAEDGRQLRIRWNGSAQLLWTAFFETVRVWASRLLEKGLFQRFAFDTYEREIERYGGEAAMKIAEAIFAVDSAVVLQLLRELDRKGEAEKTIVAVVSLSKMLFALGLNVQEQAQWCNRRVRRTPEVGTQYRSLKVKLLEGFENRGAFERPCVSDMEAFKKYEALCSEAANLRLMITEGRLEVAFDRFIDSLIHMHCNRLLGVDRAREREVIELWHRMLHSVLAQRTRLRKISD